MKRILFFATAVVLLAAVSCKKEDPPFLKVDRTSIEIPTDGENVSVPVNSNFEWLVKSDQTWAKVKRNVEKGTVDIYVSQNSTTDNREAVVTLYSDQDGFPSATISVTQNQKNAIAIDGSSSFELTAEEQVLELKLKSNVGYTVSIPQEASSWISLQPITKGMQPVSTNIYLSANQAMTERRAEITVKAAECNDITVSILQKGRHQSLKFTVGEVSQFTLPSLTTDDTEVKVLWADQSKYFYNGMVIDVEEAPADVEIQGRRITGIEFRNIVSLDAIDVTKLY